MKKITVLFAFTAMMLVLAASCVSGAAPAVDPTAGLTNAAAGKTADSNNHIQNYTSEKAVDANTQTYWEGAADAYPNELTVDLGVEMAVAGIKVKVNPKKIWQARSQTFSILGSADGTSFAVIKDSSNYDFDPANGENSVTIAVTAKARFVRLSFTANSQATGGQVAEFEVYAK